MTHRASLGVFLLLVVLLAANVSAEEGAPVQQERDAGQLDVSPPDPASPDPALDLDDLELLMQWLGQGILVEPSSALDFRDRLHLVLRYALLQAPRFAPLYVYDRGVACNGDHLAQLRSHTGSAAILVTSIRTGDEENANALAIYRPTVLDAVTDAALLWCKILGWHLATTFPLDGIPTDGDPYAARVERVNEALLVYHASEQQQLAKSGIVLGGSVYAGAGEDPAEIDFAGILLAAAVRD